MIRIVRMELCHVPQIADLEKLCFSAPWPAATIEGECKNPLALWLVAEEDGVVAGYVGSQTVLGESDMMNIAVAPDYRRKGVARGLIEALISQLRSEGAYQLTLEVRVSNAPAIALYESLGFQQVGCRPRYYYNPREDALILRKEWTV